MTTSCMARGSNRPAALVLFVSLVIAAAANAQGNSGSAPGRSGGAPGNSGNAPGHLRAAPSSSDASSSRLSGMRDTSTMDSPDVARGGGPGPLTAPDISGRSSDAGIGASTEAGPGTGSFNGAGTVGGISPSGTSSTTPGTNVGIGAAPSTGLSGTNGTVINNVNDIEYRLTPGGTYFPGYSPVGGMVYYPGPTSSEPGRPAEQQRQASPATPDHSLGQKITHVEALDGLTYADTVDVQNNIRRFQLIDSVKILSVPERRALRAKLLDSSVATGSQNIITRFLREAELIQPHHIVVGVVPRKNIILVGVKSSEEQ